MKVLIIEDDIQLNTTVSDFLRDNGYNVASSYDGDDSIKEIDSTKCKFFPYSTSIASKNPTYRYIF